MQPALSNESGVELQRLVALLRGNLQAAQRGDRPKLMQRWGSFTGQIRGTGLGLEFEHTACSPNLDFAIPLTSFQRQRPLPLPNHTSQKQQGAQAVPRPHPDHAAVLLRRRGEEDRRRGGPC
jgi:hypothetical protein